MIENKFNFEQKKIIDAIATVYDKLIEFKKSKDSELVVMKSGKIIRTKPWLAKK
jgi:hypothetical protein